MKKILFTLALTIMMLLTMALMVSAEEITVVDGTDEITLGACVIEDLGREIPEPSSGFTYVLNTETMTAKITKWENYADPVLGAKFVIPTTVTYAGSTYTVTSFNDIIGYTDNGKGETNKNYILTHVYIPDTLITIPSSAFQNCAALEYVYIGGGLEVWGSDAFNFAGTTVGGYFVDNGTGTKVSIETTGENMGDIKEFILKSKKVTELPSGIFHHTEFDKEAYIEMDITQFTTFGSHCISLNQHALTDNHHFKGTGLRFDVFDIRNATSIADDAFYYAYGGKTMILYAEQTKYFNADSLRSQGAGYYNEETENDGTFIIIGGETPETARTLGGPLWTANAYYWYGSTIFMNFIIKGYVKAYDGVDGLLNQNGYGIDQVDYFFDSEDAFKFYYDSIASTTSAEETYTRYAKNNKGYFTYCDNTGVNGHNAVEYKLTYDSTTKTPALVLYKESRETQTSVLGERLPTCILDGGIQYGCDVCGEAVSVESNGQEKLGHNFDVNAGAELVGIFYGSYMEQGEKEIGCSRCSAINNEELSPIFASSGFSIKIENGKVSVTNGFTVDNVALIEYENYLKAKGQEIEILLFIANANTEYFGSATDFVVDGELQTEKGFHVVIEGREFSNIKVSIENFTSSLKDFALVYAIYVDNGEEVKYIQVK